MEQVDMTVQKRKDLKFISGLRGLSITLVLLYHFEFPFFSNGFLGVDVFFWISGYLLFRGFLLEYEENRLKSKRRQGWIDVRYYFIRRFRRIVPVTIFILSAYLIFLGLIHGIDYVKTLNRQIFGILTFTYNSTLASSNVNYYDQLAVDRGLLHFWSLSVEEQIYVFLPFAFLSATNMHGLYLFKKHFGWKARLIFLVSILSFLSYLMVLFSDKLGISNSFVFYSAFTRFWEFGLGGLVAILEHTKILDLANKLYLRFAAIISQIVFCYFLFLVPTEGFGWTALVPIMALSVFYIGTVAASTNSLFSKTIEMPHFQMLGKIAFPLYLIHWPVVSQLIRDERLSVPIFQIIGVAFSIGMAAVVTKYIERPILEINLSAFKRIAPEMRSVRKKRPINPKVTLYGLATYLMLLLFVTDQNYFNQQLVSAKDFLVNSSATAEVSELIENQPAPTTRVDSETVPAEVESNSLIETSTLNQKIETDISDRSAFFSAWKASLYTAGVAKKLPAGYNFSQEELIQEQNDSWNSGCLNSGTNREPCSYGSGSKTAIVVGDSYAFALVPGIRASLSREWKIVILTRGLCLPWFGENYYLDGRRDLDCEAHNQWVKSQVAIIKPELVIFSAADKVASGRTMSSWKNSFLTTIKEYGSLTERIAVVPVVPGSGNLKTCMTEKENIQGCFGKSSPIAEFARIQTENAKLMNYKVLDLTTFLCSGAYCPPIIDGTPVYVDGNHLSSHFSRKLARVFQYLGIE
jgi:peptidoglycan/LPS O-acetylase OafA/YrhL